MKTEKNQNLTEGPLKKKILLFSLPLIFSNLLQVLFNISDIAVVGQFSGADALGSVGSTSILIALLTSIVMGMGSGVNIITAQHIGAGDSERVRACVHTSFLLCLFTGALISIICIPCGRLILLLLKTKSQLIGEAALYLRIYICGMPALAVYNFGNAVYSARGDTRKPLLFLSIGGVMNVALNLLFVIVFKLSAAGVGLASAISQYISAGLVIVSLLRNKTDIALKPGEIRIDRNEARRVLPLGLSTALQNSIFQIANLFIQTAVNSFDAVTVEGISAATNADSLVYDVMNAFYVACASFMGQNYGAGKRKRVLNSYFISLAYAFGIGLFMGVMLAVFGRTFLSVFTREEPVIEAGLVRLRIMGISYGFSAFMDATIAASRSLGKSTVPTAIVIIGSCVFRVVWILTVFACFRTTESIYLLYIFSWTITAACEIIYFIRIWKKTLVKCQLKS